MSTYEKRSHAAHAAAAELRLSEPTLIRLQGRRRKRGSSLIVPLVALVAVVVVGAAGVYAVTGPHHAPSHAAQAMTAGHAVSGG